MFAEDDEDDLFSSPKPKVLPVKIFLIIVIKQNPSYVHSVWTDLFFVLQKIAEKPSKPADKAPLASPEPVSETEVGLFFFFSLHTDKVLC